MATVARPRTLNAAATPQTPVMNSSSEMAIPSSATRPRCSRSSAGRTIVRPVAGGRGPSPSSFVLHDGKALIIDALYAPQPALPRLVGGALPLHCTAVGKAIVASLESAERERRSACCSLLAERRPAPAEAIRGPLVGVKADEARGARERALGGCPGEQRRDLLGVHAHRLADQVAAGG